MAAATTIALVGAGLAVAGGGAQAISGAVRAKRARRDIENFQRQEVTDLSNNLRVSTLGAEMQQTGAAQSEATQVDALQSAGARGVIGGLGQVQRQRAATEQSIAANLDQQMANIEQLRYQEKVRGFNVMEQRQNQELAGMGMELQAGRQAVQQGIGTIASGIAQGATTYASAAAAPGAAKPFTGGKELIGG